METAKLFLVEGSKVLIVDLRTANAEENPDLAEAIKEQRVFFQSADVTSEDFVKAYNEKALNFFGRVDIIVLGAGVGHKLRPWLDIPEAMFDLHMKVNARGGMSSFTFLRLAHADANLQFGLV